MQTPREAARERQLFEAFVAGDDGAFGTLFQHYHERLVRDARRYVPAELAEDLVQDLFTWLWMHRTRWAIRSTVRNYLHTAVRNRARDLLARAKTEHLAAETFYRTAGATHAPGPEELLLLTELEQTIAHGLDTCPRRCREALLLVADCRRYAEVARRLGIKSGTVQALLKRARRHLRAHLRDHGWGDVVGAQSLLSLLRARARRAGRRPEDGPAGGGPDRGPDPDFDLAG